MLIPFCSTGQVYFDPDTAATKFDRTWYASNFNVYPSDCMDDWWGVQRAVDSAKKLPGITRFIYDNGWKKMDWSQSNSSYEKFSILFDSVGWFYCMFKPVVFRTDKRKQWIIFDFESERERFLGATFYTDTCRPCLINKKAF